MNFLNDMGKRWSNFIVNYNETYMKMSEMTYDYLCKLFCDTMKPTALEFARAYTKRLEEQQRQQQLLNKTFTYS